MGGKLRGYLWIDRSDGLVDERVGLIAMPFRLRYGDADAVVVDEEAVSARADGTCIRFDQVPHRIEVHARAYDRDDLPAGVAYRRREEQRWAEADHRVRGVDDVGSPCKPGGEVLPELHAG